MEVIGNLQLVVVSAYVQLDSGWWWGRFCLAGVEVVVTTFAEWLWPPEDSVSYCNNSISGCWDASTLIQCLSCFASTGWRCRWSWTTATICPLVVFVVASALLPFGLSWSSWPLLPTICLVCNAQCYLSECSVVAALVCFVLVEEDTPPLPTPRHLTLVFRCSSLFTFKGTVIQFLPKGINCTVLRCAIQFLPKGIN